MSLPIQSFLALTSLVSGTAVARLSPAQRTRKLPDSEYTPALRKLRDALGAQVYGNDHHLHIEGRCAGADVLIALETRKKGSTMMVSLAAPAGLWFVVQRESLSKPARGAAIDQWTPRGKSLYCDDEVLGKKLAASRSVAECLDKVSSDPRFSFALSDATLTATGTVDAEHLSDEFVIELIKQMLRLVRTLEGLPEVRQRVAEHLSKKRSRRKYYVWAGIAASIALLGLLGYVRHWRREPSVWAHPVAEEGWRPVQAADMDSESLAFLRDHHQSPSSSLPADLVGSGGESGRVDILVRSATDSDQDTPKYKLVVQTFAGGPFERSYKSFAFALVVSNRQLNKIPWIGEKPISLSIRDGILVVQHRSDSRSGEFLLFDGKVLRVYHPEDYRRF